MNQLQAVCHYIAEMGYPCAIVGPNEIQTDAPEEVCRAAVASVQQTALSRGEQGQGVTIRRRKRSRRAAAKAAAPAPRRRRRKTTKQFRRKVRAAKIKSHAIFKRGQFGNPTPFKRAKDAERKLINELFRRQTRKTTKRRRKGRKLTGAAKAAFLARMASGRRK